MEGATLRPFANADRMNYRAYTVSGEAVPAMGWRVRDGGFMDVVGPDGATIRGDWGGPDGRSYGCAAMVRSTSLLETS